MASSWLCLDVRQVKLETKSRLDELDDILFLFVLYFVGSDRLLVGWLM